MPLYEFRCPEGHDFEKFYRSISSAPSEEKCPECGLMAERRISAVGLVFKGSGFYITDYGKDGKKQQNPAKESSPKPAESTAPVSSEAKPAATEAKSTPAPKKAE